ncbi:MAG: prephenate dehydrogenase/arogenate dehydrogenase family protein, partial [Desulfobacterales bacterium]|nr:prephenate dehydrogenase/arogenate dehydrogenase family protein [Desulfobacterales bacterium]
METVTLGIAGGHGGMGRLFARWFGERGHKVMVSDLGTSETLVDLARSCDLVMIATPMDVAGGVAKELGALLSKEQGLCDICSLKEEIAGVMLAESRCEVVGTHPMFGPHTESL